VVEVAKKARQKGKEKILAQLKDQKEAYFSIPDIYKQLSNKLKDKIPLPLINILTPRIPPPSIME